MPDNTRKAFTFSSRYYKAGRGLPAKKRLAFYDDIIGQGLDGGRVSIRRALQGITKEKEGAQP